MQGTTEPRTMMNDQQGDGLQWQLHGSDGAIHLGKNASPNMDAT